MATLISEANLGAWLVRGNPIKWDLPGFIRDGGEWISNWTVVRNYRSAMMKPGDRIVLWVTGNGRLVSLAEIIAAGDRSVERPARGIWGIGYVTGFAQDEIPDDADAVDVGYWLDEDARLAEDYSIDVDVPLLETALTDAEIRAVGIDDLEVQVQPQVSNPSWITKDQLARLETLLPPWPEEVEEDETISVAPKGGAGFGDAFSNAVVEAAAIAAVQEYYEAGGWHIADVSADKIGWDLTCTSRDGDVIHLEVKGVRGDRPSVFLTANEIRCAKRDERWWLAVVTHALSAPNVTEFDAATAVAASRAYLYKADLASE